jgi:hypothetical protein
LKLIKRIEKERRAEEWRETHRVQAQHDSL